MHKDFKKAHFKHKTTQNDYTDIKRPERNSSNNRDYNMTTKQTTELQRDTKLH